MAVKPTPEGYHTVTPYLIVQNVTELIQFLKRAFEAVETSNIKGSDDRIIHAQVKIGDSILMMGESSSEFKPIPGSLYLYVDDTDEKYKRALEAGAESIQEPVDMYYGDRNAGVKDQSGNLWWIATHIEDVSPDEVERRTRAAEQS